MIVASPKSITELKQHHRPPRQGAVRRLRHVRHGVPGRRRARGRHRRLRRAHGPQARRQAAWRSSRSRSSASARTSSSRTWPAVGAQRGHRLLRLRRRRAGPRRALPQASPSTPPSTRSSSASSKSRPSGPRSAWAAATACSPTSAASARSPAAPSACSTAPAAAHGRALRGRRRPPLRLAAHLQAAEGHRPARPPGGDRPAQGLAHRLARRRAQDRPRRTPGLKVARPGTSVLIGSSGYLGENSLQAHDQWREVDLDCVADAIEVDVEVCVDQAIPHADDVRPGDLGSAARSSSLILDAASPMISMHFTRASVSTRSPRSSPLVYCAASNDHSLTVVARQHLTEAQAPSRDREGAVKEHHLRRSTLVHPEPKVTASRAASSMCRMRTRSLDGILNRRGSDDLVPEVAAEFARRPEVDFAASKERG